MAVSCPEVMYGAYYPYLYGRGAARSFHHAPHFQYDRFNVGSGGEGYGAGGGGGAVGALSTGSGSSGAQSPASPPHAHAHHHAHQHAHGPHAPHAPHAPRLRTKEEDLSAHGRASADGGGGGSSDSEGECGRGGGGGGAGRGEARAQYVSANCVVFTHYSGDVAAVVDDHFTRALSVDKQKEGVPMGSRNLPASFFNAAAPAGVPAACAQVDLYDYDPWHQHYSGYGHAAHRHAAEYHAAAQAHHNMAAAAGYGGLLLGRGMPQYKPVEWSQPHIDPAACAPYSYPAVPGQYTRTPQAHHNMAAAAGYGGLLLGRGMPQYKPVEWSQPHIDPAACAPYSYPAVPGQYTRTPQAHHNMAAAAGYGGLLLGRGMPQYKPVEWSQPHIDPAACAPYSYPAVPGQYTRTPQAHHNMAAAAGYGGLLLGRGMPQYKPVEWSQPHIDPAACAPYSYPAVPGQYTRTPQAHHNMAAAAGYGGLLLGRGMPQYKPVEWSQPHIDPAACAPYSYPAVPGQYTRTPQAHHNMAAAAGYGGLLLGRGMPQYKPVEWSQPHIDPAACAPYSYPAVPGQYTRTPQAHHNMAAAAGYGGLLLGRGMPQYKPVEWSQPHIDPAACAPYSYPAVPGQYTRTPQAHHNMAAAAGYGGLLLGRGMPQYKPVEWSQPHIDPAACAPYSYPAVPGQYTRTPQAHHNMAAAAGYGGLLLGRGMPQYKPVEWSQPHIDPAACAPYSYPAVPGQYTRTPQAHHNMAAAAGYGGLLLGRGMPQYKPVEWSQPHIDPAACAPYSYPAVPGQYTRTPQAHHNMAAAAGYGGLLLGRGMPQYKPVEWSQPHIDPAACAPYSYPAVPGQYTRTPQAHHNMAAAAGYGGLLLGRGMPQYKPVEWSQPHIDPAACAPYSYPAVPGLEAQVQDTSKDLYWF